MLPLTLTAAPVQTAEVVALEAPPEVLEGRGVEVPAEVEPAAEEPAAEEELLEPPVAVAEAEAEEEAESVAEAELELSVAEAEEEALVVEPAEVVSIGGTEMGWPAEEHWATTALETAGRVVSMICFFEWRGALIE
jgi:fused signal recognition particle receptor